MNKSSVIFLIILGILFLVSIFFVSYVYIKYGGTPIAELPAWVLPFFVE